MMTELSNVGHSVIIEVNRTEVIIDLSRLFAAYVLLHTHPVLKRAVNECLRGYGDDGVVEVAHLDGGQRDVLHPAVDTSATDGNPVTDMNHVIVCQADASHQTLDGVLKGQHQDSRGSPQSGKQR